MSGGLEIRLAEPDEYEAIDRLVEVAYAHDYGPSEHGDDPMRRAANRAREYDLWVAVDAGGEGRAAGVAAGDVAEAGDTGDTSDTGHTGDADASVGPAANAPSPTLLGSVTTRRAGSRPLHEDFGNALDLRLLAVSPDARRRGVGAALMRHIIETAQASGFEAVALKTAPNMVGAHRLYESLGFQRWPERDGLWIDGVRLLDLYSYVYPLEGSVGLPARPTVQRAESSDAALDLAVAGSSQAPQT